jgi:hypothetical protein
MVKVIKTSAQISAALSLAAIVMTIGTTTTLSTQRREVPGYGTVRIYFVPFTTQTLKGISSKDMIDQHDMTSLMKRSHELIKESLGQVDEACTIDPGQIRLRIDGLDDESILVDRSGCVLRRGVDRRLTDAGFKRLKFAFYSATPVVAYPYEK